MPFVPAAAAFSLRNARQSSVGSKNPRGPLPIGYLVPASAREEYGREELVAEMCGAFVCAALSIVQTVRHADYLGAWLDVLREDNRAIVRAASAASKAADYLLAFRDPAP